MAYWKCYYHVIWATKNRAPTLLPAYETILFPYLESRAADHQCRVLAINGTDDHIHLALTIPPTAAPAEIMSSLKGASSRELNLTFQPEEKFRWQDSYGILTFSESALHFITQYIHDQKTHHAQGSVDERLETFE